MSHFVFSPRKDWVPGGLECQRRKNRYKEPRVAASPVWQGIAPAPLTGIAPHNKPSHMHNSRLYSARRKVVGPRNDFDQGPATVAELGNRRGTHASKCRKLAQSQRLRQRHAPGWTGRRKVVTRCEAVRMAGWLLGGELRLLVGGHSFRSALVSKARRH